MPCGNPKIERNKEIIYFLDDAYTFDEIAEILNITRNQVAGVAYRRNRYEKKY